jgi:hypothetical protein
MPSIQSVPLPLFILKMVLGKELTSALLPRGGELSSFHNVSSAVS